MTTNTNNASGNAPAGELRRSDSSSSLSASFLCADSSTLQESSSSLGAAWGETSMSRAIRMFNSSTSNLKDTKSKTVSPLSKGYGSRTKRRSSELELDNSQSLSSLVLLMNEEKKIGSDFLDNSFESDIDESGRWLKQL